MKKKEKESISLDEITFIDKNKAYGAYELRSNYVSNLNKAYLIGLCGFLFVLMAPRLFAKFANNDKITTVILLPPMSYLPTPKEPIKPEIEKIPEKQVQAKTKFLQIVIVPDDKVVDDTPPPTQDMLLKAPAGQETIEANGNGIDDVIIEEKPVEKIEIVTVAPEKEVIFTKLEQISTFPGGLSAMAAFLGKNIKYPRQASNAGVSGKVYLSFLVEKSGEISEISVIKGIGFGCDEEAERVIKLMPKWIPGKQSGQAVKSRFNMPIVFVLE